MKLKAQVVEFLESVYPVTFTNKEIACQLAANESSVRRVTRQLVSVGAIEADATQGGHAGLPIQYRANAPQTVLG